METMNAQEQEQERAWRYAKSCIMGKVLGRMLRFSHFGFSPYYVDAATHEEVPAGRIVDDTFVILKRDFEQSGVRPTRRSFAENCPNRELGKLVLRMWRDPFRKIV